MPNKTLYAGADVSADWIDACRQLESDRAEEAQLEHHRFANEPDGHEKLIDWLGGEGHAAQIAVEASGVYSSTARTSAWRSTPPIRLT